MDENEMMRLRQALSYLLDDTLPLPQQKERLSAAYWEATNAGYGDAMAGRLMAGMADAQTARWEQNCTHRAQIRRLLCLLDDGEEAPG